MHNVVVDPMTGRVYARLHPRPGPANEAAPPVDSYNGGNSNPLLLLLLRIEELFTGLLQSFQDLQPETQGGSPVPPPQTQGGERPAGGQQGQQGAASTPPAAPVAAAPPPTASSGNISITTPGPIITPSSPPTASSGNISPIITPGLIETPFPPGISPYGLRYEEESDDHLRGLLRSLDNMPMGGGGSSRISCSVVLRTSKLRSANE